MPNGKLKIKKTGANTWQVDAQSGSNEFDLEVEDSNGTKKNPKSVKVDFSSNDQTIIVDP